MPIELISVFKLLALITLTAVVEGTDSRISEDAKLKFPELAAKYGHPAEEHDVTTEDGYILTMFRLPGRKTKPVLLVHGNGVDSDCYIVRGNTSLAITLASKGYDVWAINLRGTRYSQRHVSIDATKEPERFYNYTFYEQGVYDVPATIDYILQQTGQTQVLGIGYSVGTTTFYVMGAERPEYNDKIKAHISLAPICFLKHLKGIVRTTGDTSNTIEAVFNLAHIEEVGDKNLTSVCSGGQLAYDVCVKGLLFNTFGSDEAGLEPEFMSTFFGHFPSSTSTKLFSHLFQVYRRDKFAKFDYGVSKNWKLYNSREPPNFDLSKVTMKIALLVGRADYLATVADVERLADLLPNVVHNLVMPYKQFNHLDFAYGQYMTDNLYPYLLKLVKKYI